MQEHKTKMGPKKNPTRQCRDFVRYLENTLYYSFGARFTNLVQLFCSHLQFWCSQNTDLVHEFFSDHT